MWGKGQVPLGWRHWRFDPTGSWDLPQWTSPFFLEAEGDTVSWVTLRSHKLPRLTAHLAIHLIEAQSLSWKGTRPHLPQHLIYCLYPQLTFLYIFTYFVFSFSVPVERYFTFFLRLSPCHSTLLLACDLVLHHCSSTPLPLPLCLLITQSISCWTKPNKRKPRRVSCSPSTNCQISL